MRNWRLFPNDNSEAHQLRFDAGVLKWLNRGKPRRVMMNFSVYTLIGSALLLVITTANADDSFRCGTHIIDVGDQREEVLEHCGQPTTEEGWTWTYDRGPEEMRVLVHFEADGTVGRIEEGDAM
jgi:hypothetical protein